MSIEHFNRIVSEAEAIIQALKVLDETSLGQFNTVSFDRLSSVVLEAQREFQILIEGLTEESLEQAVQNSILNLRASIKQYVNLIYSTIVSSTYLDSLMTYSEEQHHHLMMACKPFIEGEPMKELLSRWDAFYFVHCTMKEINQRKQENTRLESDTKSIKRETQKLERTLHDELPMRFMSEARRRQEALNQRREDISRMVDRFRQERPTTEGARYQGTFIPSGRVERIFNGNGTESQDDSKEPTSAVERVFGK